METYNNTSNTLQFSFKNSLSQKLDGKPPTFYELSQVLKNTASPIENIADLALRIRDFRGRPKSQNASLEKLKKYFRDLFANQFSDTPLAALGESVANALDAQTSRMQKEFSESISPDQFPVTIKINEKEIVITDHGTGIGLSQNLETGRSSVAHLVLPGFTTKYKDVQSNERRVGVVGRFGQGFLANFYFLIYPETNRHQSIPTFKTPLELTNLLTVYATDEKGQTHQMIFSFEEDQIQVLSKLIIEPSSLQDRIKIVSCDEGNQTLELDFFHENGELLVDVSIPHSLNNSELDQGTTISIESGLVAKIQGKAKEYLTQKFSLYERFPINIQTPEGTRLINTVNNNLIKIEFNGGALLFDELTTTQKGTIGIYENGIQIMELPTTGEVPIKIALNFNSLSLTSERATVDFKELTPQLIACVDELMECKISNKSKALIFNALHVIIKKNNLKELMQLIKHYAQAFAAYPDNAVIREMGVFEPIFLNPDYVTAFPGKLIFEQEKVLIYSVPCFFKKPFVTFSLLKKRIILVNLQFFDVQNPLFCRLNFEWLKIIAEEKKSQKLLLNVNKAIEVMFPQTVKQPSHLIDDMDIAEEKEIEGVLYEKENIMSDEEVQNSPPIVRETVEGIKNQMMDSHSKRTPKTISELMNNESKIDEISQGKLHILISVLKRSENLSLLTSKAYLLEGLFPGLMYQFLMHIPYEVTKNELSFIMADLASIEESMLENYLYYLMRQIERNRQNENKYVPISSLKGVFLRLKEITNSCEIVSDEKMALFFGFPPPVETLNQYERLLQKIAKVGSRSRILPVLIFVEPDDLIQFTPDQIQSLIDILPVKEMLEIKIRLFKSDFDLMYNHIILGQSDASLKVKRGSASLYYALKGLSCGRLKFNFENFFQILPSVKFLNCKTEDDYSEHLKILKKSIDNIRTTYTKQFFDFYEYITSAVRRGDSELSECNLLKKIMENTENKIDGLKRLIPKCFPIIEYIELRLKNDDIGILNLFTSVWEKNSYIPDTAPEIFIAICTASNEKPESRDYLFPNSDANSIPLDSYPPVIEFYTTTEAALLSIRHALKQNIEDGFPLHEIVKNAREAIQEFQKTDQVEGQIDIEFFIDAEGYAIFSIHDNGVGMNQEEINAFFTPNFSTKGSKNFGRGIFSAFLKFGNKGLVKTVKAGHEEIQCLWHRDESDRLFINFGDFEKPRLNHGTSLIFREKVADITIHSIKLQAAISRLKAVKGVSISYNGNKVNEHRVPFAVEHQEPYQIGVIPFTLTAGLSASFSGLYINEMRMGDIPDEYFKDLPKLLKDFLFESGFSIFLPEVQQVMNRNQLIIEDNLNISIKRATLMVSIKSALKNILEDKSIWKKLSLDLLDEFSMELNLSENQEKIIQFYKSNEEFHLNNERELSIKDRVLDLIREQTKLTFSTPSFSNLSSADFADLLTNEDLKERAITQMELLNQEFADEESCLLMLITCL